MPEIAEVETFKRQLEPLLIGQKIVSCDTFHPRSTRRHKSNRDFINKLVGREVVTFARHGKYLAAILDNGSYLNIHLRMSGRLLVSKKLEYKREENPKHSHIIFETLNDVFVFVDPRTFGEMWITDSMPIEHDKGIDALNSSSGELQKMLKANLKSKKTLKSFLLDQQFITGIGNIYSDEICYHAKVHPAMPLNALDEKSVSKVVLAIKVVLPLACELRGSSLRDESFRDLYGEIGSYQKEHKIHAKAGEPCECGAEIQHIKVAGRSTYFCPSCQESQS